MNGLWYKDLFSGKFGKYWVELYFSEKRRDYTKKEISFLGDALKKGFILDLCCGPGRHSVPLSFYGEVVSYDLSKYLLSVAKERGEENGSYKNLNLIKGDMRRLPFKSYSFDDVMNMQTSFGYFSGEENGYVLEEVSRVLKPNGIFVLEIANPGWILKNFREKSWVETDSFYILVKRSLDWKRKRMRNRWIWIDKEEREISEISFDHRLYDLNELVDLLTKVNLGITNIYGSPEKEEFDETESKRILILSKKLK